MSLENSTNIWNDDNEQEESEQEIGENENESSTDVHNNNTNEMTRIPEITTEELRTAINKLEKGKFPDSNGIRVEDIKACDDETREMVRHIFNEIIKQNDVTQEEESETKSDIQKRRCGKCWDLPPALYMEESSKQSDIQASWRRCGKCWSNMFEIKKGTKQGDPLWACFSTWFYRKHWKTTSRAGKRKKEWEFTWVTTTTTASLTWDLPTTCSWLHPPNNSFKKCCAFSRKVLKKWDSGFIQKRRKFSATKATKARTQKKEIEVDDIKVEILTRGESVKYLGQKITFCNRRRPKSGIESRLAGRHFTSTGRSWHRKTTCSNIDSGCSTQW